MRMRRVISLSIQWEPSWGLFSWLVVPSPFLSLSFKIFIWYLKIFLIKSEVALLWISFEHPPNSRHVLKDDWSIMHVFHFKSNFSDSSENWFMNSVRHFLIYSKIFRRCNEERHMTPISTFWGRLSGGDCRLNDSWTVT